MARHVAAALALARKLSRNDSPQTVTAALKLAAADSSSFYRPTSLGPLEKCCQILAYDDAATAAVFEFGPRAEIPLHDHPGAVASVVLRGHLRCVSFDLSKSVSGSVTGRCGENVVAGPGDILISLPSEGALHAFYSAAGGTAVLDILWPSYSPTRECTYFELPVGQPGARSRSLWDTTPGDFVELRRLPAEPPGWELPFEVRYAGEPL